MKLYATVTSERATKGQGGHKQVEILLQIDPKLRLEVGRLVMTCEDDKYKIYYYPINENCTDQVYKSGRILLYETMGDKKGEKEKSELCKYCPRSNRNVATATNDYDKWICDACA